MSWQGQGDLPSRVRGWSSELHFPNIIFVWGSDEHTFRNEQALVNALVLDKLRPDILMIEGLPLHAGIALTTASPSLSHLQRSCRIHII